MIIIIPLLALVLGLSTAWFFQSRGWTTAAWTLFFVLTALLFWGIYLSNAAQGWDALGYAIVWMLGTGPTLIGVILGAIIGRWRRHRAEEAV